MGSRKLKFSRWRRLPGVSRVTERRIPGPDEEMQRLTLYVPGKILDRAEAQSNRAGDATIQAYCERLLIDAIEAEHARGNLAETEARRGPLVGLDAIANDPEYLVEWSASHGPRQGGPSEPEPVREPSSQLVLEGAMPATYPALDPTPSDEPSPAGTILRHAAVAGDDPAGLLATLRRGETIGPDTAREVLQALLALERETAGDGRIDRSLAFALHRLAFEGQILLTDAWPGLAADAATVDALRLIQEGVDRVLSGEDIRYYAEQPDRGEAPWTGDGQPS